jgi:hypothetical protein
MGSEVMARCECGVEAEIMIGGGMLDFMTTCYFPCLCESCQAVVQSNLLEEPPRCPECGAENPTPYDDKSVIGAEGENVVADWNLQGKLSRELILTDGNYKCPKCRNMTLHFSDSGLCWD